MSLKTGGLVTCLSASGRMNDPWPHHSAPMPLPRWYFSAVKCHINIVCLLINLIPHQNQVTPLMVLEYRWIARPLLLTCMGPPTVQTHTSHLYETFQNRVNVIRAGADSRARLLFNQRQRVFCKRLEMKTIFQKAILHEDVGLLESCVLKMSDSPGLTMVTWGEQLITKDEQGQIAQCPSCC